MLNRYRKEASYGAAVLLLLISFIANYFIPEIGIEFSMAGLLAIIGLGVLALLVAILYEIIFVGKQMIMKYFLIAFSVLVLTTWVTPLADYIVQLLPFI